MYNDKRFAKFFPNARKTLRIDGISGLAIMPGIKVLFLYTEDKTPYHPQINYLAELWHIDDQGSRLLIPLSSIPILSPGSLSAMGMFTAGSFHIRKGIVWYEYDDFKYEIPYNTRIKFSNDIPVGLTAKPIVTRGPKSITSSW